MVADRNVEMARRIVNGDCEVVSDGDLLVNNPDVDIVVELIGGYGVARISFSRPLPTASMW